MTIIARGIEQVRAFERAIGGEPPVATAERSKQLLTTYMSAQLEHRNVHRKLSGELLDLQREIALSPASADKLRSTSYAERKNRILHERKPHHVAPRSEVSVEWEVRLGSNFIVKALPFDVDWHSGPGSGGSTSADKSGGTFTMAMQSFGHGGLAAASGVAAWFFCAQSDPQQRFAALLKYSFDWWDDANFFVVDDNFRTRLWVFGHSENDWVIQSDQGPSWSDHEGWLDSNNGADDGLIPLETFFPARANSWYLAWVWGLGDIYSDGGAFGGDASLHFNGQVPFMVFGSL